MIILVSEGLLIKKEVIIMAITIQVKDLQQGYGKTIVLKDINLTVHNGEILGLIGPSGAGKTTLVSTIMGMLTPQKGTVTVLGQQMPNRKLLAKKLSKIS